MKTDQKYEQWTDFDCSQLDNFTLLHPHKDQDHFDFTVPPGSFYIVLGLKKCQWGKYWFKITQDKYSMKDAEDYNGSSNEGGIEGLITQDVRDCDIDGDYYDYYSQSIDSASKELKFKNDVVQPFSYHNSKIEEIYLAL